jgi:hypothetical protein
MAYPRYQLSRAHRQVRRAAGSNMATTNVGTTWTDLGAATNGPGATALDIDLEAQDGDVIEYGFSGLASSEAVAAKLDVQLVDSGNYISSLTTVPTTNGVTGWYCPASALTPITGSLMYTVTALDIASGKVKLRPMYLTTGVRTLFTNGTDGALVLTAKNLGPADPE